jgi:hypothetical protein
MGNEQLFLLGVIGAFVGHIVLDGVNKFASPETSAALMSSRGLSMIVAASSAGVGVIIAHKLLKE